jgi:hypothetical protein
MDIFEQRKTYFGEIERGAKTIDRKLKDLADKESTAKQRRALTQASEIISKAIRHVGKVMGI